MNALTTYLLDKKVLEPDTLYWITKHRKWCVLYGTTPQTIQRNEVIEYIELLVMQYQHKGTINTILDKIKWYYEYLIQKQQIKTNPFVYAQIESDKNRIFKQITSLLHVPNRYDTIPNH
ncbi:MULTISPECIES: hypothetical protein [unclassified Aquimarina]|uniref:hypothetical protein n=1 Tax=unclassified Aquimarina TaxID=2627091 RepID=UPI0018C94077|nr:MULTISPECIES: hypothetical protein [unclassified Aquimarina]MBG6130726.1 site-specific recombinase XerD [Aquimarina sp. EL_35]MBG6151128.1 site-specific recombinase XerD [Aquimarina sp. EL_32]